MTESLIVLATAIAGLLLADPFFAGALTKAAAGKFLLLAFGMGSLSFQIAGRALTAPGRVRTVVGEVVAVWWPAIVLALWILAGSAYARLADGIKESFLGMGLGILFLPLMAIAIRSSAHTVGLLKALAAVYGLLVVGMLIVLLSGYHVFHEEVFVAMPVGAYLLCSRRLRLWQAVLGLAWIAACVYSFKNTTFLLALTTLSGCLLVWAIRGLHKRDPLTVLTGSYFGILLFAGAVTALVLGWMHYRSLLPSGNVEYRTEMYGIAWHRFLDSPLWGTGFTDSSVNYFKLYHVATAVQNLPTHSDVLDLLSHGGLIAIALWLSILWRVLVIGWDAAWHVAVGDPDDNPLGWRWLFLLVLIQVGAVVTYAVNPPLINPVHGFWIWGGMAVMWVLHRVLVERTAPAPRTVRALRPRLVT